MSFIHVTTKDMKEQLKEFAKSDRKVVKALVRALNKTGVSARTEAARKMRETYYVKYGEVLKKIDVIKANKHTMRAVLSSKDRPIRLINFSVSPKSDSARKPKVLRVGVKKEKGRKQLKGAFITTVRGGHTGVFIRLPRPISKHIKTKDGHWSQMPIEQKTGPAIPSMLAQDNISFHIQKKSTEAMEEFVVHELKREGVIE